MATTKLVIRKDKANSKGECVIFVLYTHQQKSIKISTGEKIAPEYWDDVSCKVKKSYKGFTSLNAAIEKKEAEVKELANLAKSLGADPTVDYIREKIDNKKPGAAKLPQDFYSLFAGWIKSSAAKKTASTLAVHEDCLRIIKEFEEEKGYKVTLGSINMSFYYKFTEWMFFEYKNKRGKVGTEPNTVGKHIRTIKAFMNYMTRTGVNTNLAFQDKAFKDFNEETDIVYLTKDELEKMIRYDFSFDSKLEKVRDLFVFECAVGLRYSDIQNLKPENIKEDALDFTTIKTRDRIRIPLTSYARQILSKYNGGLPKPYGFKRMNDLLKEVGKQCGIDANEHRVKYRGSTRVEINIPKYQLLTPHCARRTFITQSLERGLRPEVIMKLTGHKSYETMKRYIKLTQDVVERELLRAWGDAPSSIKAV